MYLFNMFKGREAVEQEMHHDDVAATASARNRRHRRDGHKCRERQLHAISATLVSHI